MRSLKTWGGGVQHVGAPILMSAARGMTGSFSGGRFFAHAFESKPALHFIAWGAAGTSGGAAAEIS